MTEHISRMHDLLNNHRESDDYYQDVIAALRVEIELSTDSSWTEYCTKAIGILEVMREREESYDEG